MKHNAANITAISLLLIPALLTPCSCDLFDTHPYDVNFSGERNINATRIALIEEQFTERDSLNIAIISDTHGSYSDASDLIDDINARNFDFVIHLGDLTDTGTTTEFEWARDLLDNLQIPYVALIGNHDFLGTGEETYLKMFGQMDFSFIAANTKFLCVNTNATEYEDQDQVPDLDFIRSEASNDSNNFSQTVVCMHARPFSDQFDNNLTDSFHTCIKQMPGLLLCLNGHDHQFQNDDLFGDGIIYYGCTCAEKRGYLILTITPNGYEIQTVNL